MKYDLTKAQLEKLNKAIDLAEEPGSCKYVSDGKFCCVIAQLAFLEGVSITRLDSLLNVEEYLKEGKLPELSAYPRQLLSFMQIRWDHSASFSSIKDARDWMRQILD